MNGCFRIQELRKQNSMSQCELAKVLGYKSGAAIAMWETGDRNPPSTILPKLAQVLHCTIAELYCDMEQSNEKKAAQTGRMKEVTT